MDSLGRGAVQIARFGVPLILLLFYVSAAGHLDATPEETFFTLIQARAIGHDPAGSPAPAGGTSSPGWVLLLAAGEALGLDVLMTARVLSLFASSMALLAIFLLATEVLTDRLLAMGVMLAAAAHGWLLEAAASGSAAGAALAVVMTSLVFWRRREPVLGVFFASLAALVFWQAILLVLVQCLSVSIRKRSVGNGPGAFLTLAAVAAAVIAPWIVFAVSRGLNPLPVLLFSPTPGLPGLWDILAMSLALLLSLAWVFMAIRYGAWEDIGPNAVLLLWIAWLLVLIPATGTAMALQVFPLLIIFAIPGFTALLAPVLRRRVGLGAALAPAALVLLLLQAGMLTDHRTRLSARGDDLQGLAAAAAWVRSELPDTAVLQADRPWSLAYLAGRPVDPLVLPSAAAAVVTDRDTVPGFHRVFRPGARLADGLSAGLGRFTVWSPSKKEKP